MKCPYCSEEIQDTAKKCRFCWEWLKKENINIIDDKKIDKPEIISNNNLQKSKWFNWKIFFYILWWLCIFWIWNIQKNPIESFQIFFTWLSIIFLCKSHTNLKKRLNWNIKWKFWEILHLILWVLPIIIFILIAGKKGIVENPAIILPLVVYFVFYSKEIKKF